MLLKLNSKSPEVKTLQSKLGLTPDGIFGPATEKAVKIFQQSHSLTPDGIVGNKTWALLTAPVPEASASGSLSITKLPISIHITKKPNRPIAYLAIHYTAGASSAPGSARKTRSVFLTRSASADFIVDDKEIIQINPDLNNYYCWAVGDGKGKYGIANSNTISIEMCSTLDKGTSASVPNHSGWHVSEAVLQNTVRLASYLMQAYSIPPTNLIRHFDASRKLCPGIVGWNTGRLYDPKTGKQTANTNNDQAWLSFKTQVLNACLSV